jgi:hypothetical protein
MGSQARRPGPARPNEHASKNVNEYLDCAYGLVINSWHFDYLIV